MTTFKISEEDYLAAQRLFMRPSTATRAWRSATAVAVARIGAFGPAEISFTAWCALAGGVAGFVVVRYVMVPWRLRSSYRQYAGIRGETDIALEPEGIRYRTADANVLLRWEKILKWREDDGYVLVYHSPRLFNIVPKSLAQSGFDLGALTAALNQQVGAAS